MKQTKAKYKKSIKLIDIFPYILYYTKYSFIVKYSEICKKKNLSLIYTFHFS